MLRPQFRTAQTRKHRRGTIHRQLLPVFEAYHLIYSFQGPVLKALDAKTAQKMLAHSDGWRFGGAGNVPALPVMAGLCSSAWSPPAAAFGRRLPREATGVRCRNSEESPMKSRLRLALKFRNGLRARTRASHRPA